MGRFMMTHLGGLIFFGTVTRLVFDLIIDNLLHILIAFRWINIVGVTDDLSVTLNLFLFGGSNELEGRPLLAKLDHLLRLLLGATFLGRGDQCFVLDLRGSGLKDGVVAGASGRLLLHDLILNLVIGIFIG